MEDRRSVVFDLRVDSEALVRRPGSMSVGPVLYVRGHKTVDQDCSRKLQGRRELKPVRGRTCWSDVGLAASTLLPAPGNPKHFARGNPARATQGKSGALEFTHRC